MIGPEGQTSSLMKLEDSQFQMITPKNKELSGFMKRGSKLMALESSADCRDFDEETPHEDSLEELKGEG